MEQERIDLCNYRLERCLEEINIAELLLKEKHFKKSINSSYYAVFHGIRAVFSLNGIDFKKHDKCIAEFNRKYVNEGIFDRYFARKVDKLFRLRNKCDYDDFFLISKDDAEKQYSIAKEICIALESYTKEKIKGMV